MIEKGKKYIGFVEDIDDPKKEGYARIRVPVIHVEIPTEHIPWGKPKNAVFFGSDGLGANISIPRLGSLVEVTFSDGNIQNPEYSVIQELSDEVKELLRVDGDYENCHVMLMDGQEDLSIYYTNSNGYTIDLKGSRINFANDNVITIEHKESESMIELDGGTITTTANSQINSTAGSRIKSDALEIWQDGDLVKLGRQPQYSAVMGEPLFLLLATMASTIDAKMSPTPSLMVSAVQQFKQQVLSETVKLTRSNEGI